MRPPDPLPLITAVLLSVIENPLVAPMIVGPVPLFVIVPVTLVPVAVPTMAAPAIPVEFSVTAEDSTAFASARFNLLGLVATDCAPARLSVPPEMLPAILSILAPVWVVSPMFRVIPEPIVIGLVTVTPEVLGVVRVYPFIVKFKDATVAVAADTTPAVPWNWTMSAEAATWSAALPVEAELKVVPHVAVPPTPFPAPASVSQ
jgi:hypothetical protein